MSIWSVHARVRLVYWAHFQNLHNRPKKNLLKKEIKSLISSPDKLLEQVEDICSRLAGGDSPLDVSKLDKPKLRDTLHGLTYAAGAKAFGNAVVAALNKG